MRRTFISQLPTRLRSRTLAVVVVAALAMALAPMAIAQVTPTVTVVATDSAAAEQASDPGTFTITRTGDTTAALSVSYSVGGTATNGSDYATLTGPAVIAAGQSSVAVTVTPINDLAPEDDETVVLTLSAGTGYTVGSPSTATVTIDDNDPPVVTVVASDGSAAEAGPDSGTFTLSRTGPTTSALAVSYTMGGTATNGTDYASLTGSVTILAGSASATVTVTPINDVTAEATETAVLTLAASSAYTVGSPGSATVSIADNDGPLPPGARPTTKNQCKKGGWLTFGVFKNQGDCVSWVATGGKNPPAGAR